MTFKLVPTLVFCCLVSVLIALGFWQLGRAAEKQAFLQLEAQRSSNGNLQISAQIPDNVESVRYRKATVEGRYDISHQVLIDNQMKAGKAGYYVLTPFIVDGMKKAVLVNRGWIPLSQNRSLLPDVQFKGSETTLKGRINSFPSVGIKLQGAEVPTQSWPTLVQVVDVNVLAKAIGYPLFRFQLELDQEQTNGYQRDWSGSTIMLPEQHTAYAVQWFGLAFTLSVIFVWYIFKNNTNDTKK